MKRLVFILMLLPLVFLHGQAPGGEDDDLVFWLKANDGTSTTINGAGVAQWDDQSGNSNHAYDSGLDPTFLQIGDSYNPSIDFSTTSGGFRMNDDDDINRRSSDRKTIVVAFKTGNDISTQQMIFEQGGQKDAINMYIYNGELYCNFVDNNTDNYSSTGIAPNTSYILIFVYDGTDTDWDAYLNGTWAFGDNSAPSSWPGDNDNIGIGIVEQRTQYHNNGNASDPDSFLGQIMEIVYYDDLAFGVVQREGMFSYLGAKYGITIEDDYYFTGVGSRYWDLSNNFTYHNDVAVIIRDDLTDLEQKQGKSVNSDALVSIGYGGLAVDNASNPNNIPGDEDYLIWGNDDGNMTSFTTAGAPTGRQILGRKWYLEEDISGAMEISVPDNSSPLGAKLPSEETTVYLLADDDPDLSAGATEFAMSLNGTNWEVTANLSGYDYFTFATETPPVLSAPGGVSTDLALWLRADKGTSTTTDNTALTTWSDRSLNGNDATSDGNPPRFQNNAASNINFNPSIDFDDNNDRLVVDLSAIKNSDYTLLAVGVREDADFNIVLGGGGGTNNQDLHFGYRNSSQATLAHWGNDIDVGVLNWNNPAATPYLLSGEYDRSGRILEEIRDGNFSRNTDGNTTDLQGSKTNYVGFMGNGVGHYDGQISEIIAYSDDISDLEKLQIYSYLGLKYGFMLTNDNDNDGNPNEVVSGSIREGDIVASDGSTKLWDYSAMGASYFNDIAGIGLDTLSQLNQKQSRPGSQNPLVTIGLGSIAAGNSANANTFSNHLDFLVWGHDNSSLSGVASNADLPAQSGAVDKLQRIWKVHESGAVGDVEIAFPKASIDSYFTTYSYGNFYLRVSDDAALATNAVDIPLTESTVNGTLSYTAICDFDGTRYFSIVQKGFIIWTGTEWRGGLSTITDHAASDEPGDQSKPLFIMAGDTAHLLEAVEVDSVDIAGSGIAVVHPLSCLRTKDITSNGELILDADATGFGQYKGPAVEATVHQYIDNDGWHQIGSPFSDVTWDDLNFKNANGFINHPVSGTSTDSCNYCNLWWYDGSTDNGTDIGFMSSTAYGTWRSSTDGSQPFSPDKGWNLYLDAGQNFGSAPWTISFTGTLNAGGLSQSINENNSGWNLVANPYASVLDWDVVDDDLAAAGISPGYHVWDHSNTNFATYANGVGTLGANQYIAPLQGFYVQTAVVGPQNSADVYHSFDLDDNDRPDQCQTAGGNIFKSGLKLADHLRLRTRNQQSGKIDEMVIQFGEVASRGFQKEEDIRKLLTTHKDVPSVYAHLGNALTVITAMPVPTEGDSVNLGIQCADKSQLSIEAVEVPAGMQLYLEDLKTGKWHSLDRPFKFVHDKQLSKRFVLHYSLEPIEPRDWAHQKPFSIHMDNGFMNLQTLKRITNGEWYLTGLSGAVVAQGRVNGATGVHQKVDLRKLSPGVYVFVLFEADKKFTEKLPKIH